MTTDQVLLFGLFAAILGALLWGRVRHDLVAAAGLLIAVVIGLVPEAEVFSGFSNPAVLIVALVLIASRAFENSGALALIARFAIDRGRSVATHIAVVGGLGAALSAVINNVAALAILMPVDVRAARKAGRPPGQTLMPLAFATILGGMVTLIGTPPNIIASAVREERLGEPYGMFDFTPVGAVVAICGLLFVAFIGWRLVPLRKDPSARLDPSSFVAELVVPEGSDLSDQIAAGLDTLAEEADVLLVGIVRDGQRQRGAVRVMTIRDGDRLVVEGSTEAIATFIKAANLQRLDAEDSGEKPAASSRSVAAEDRDDSDKNGDEVSSGPEIIEAVVKSDGFIVGRSAAAIGLRTRFGITLLGIGRAGTVAREQISDRTIVAGDELLLTGRAAGSRTVLDQLGLIVVNRTSVASFRPLNALLAASLFVMAVGVATAGLLSFATAIAIAVVFYAALGLVPAREFYSQIDWAVVVMLACLLPLGFAFEDLGGTALIAEAVAGWTQSYPPVIALVAIMLVTLTLSDALNNVATIVITGPIAIDLAQRLNVNPDTFLMGVAIAASCAFLTPIGHKNNTLIMGPAGFRFSDYWRMGLPLELVVLVVSVPMLILVWPL